MSRAGHLIVLRQAHYATNDFDLHLQNLIGGKVFL